ncbi:hypothetical protein ACFYSH_16855 [Streptomyces sp. NPDC005791]|uniref:hypothetical protein n=1 Tax=Streptomyces sp. NPDC005791 TaxID=3364732 RepID=UPI00369B7B74
MEATAHEGGRTAGDRGGPGRRPRCADSTGPHAVPHARRRHDEAGVRLVAAGPLTTGVRRLFEVSGTLGAFGSAAAAPTC